MTRLKLKRQTVDTKGKLQPPVGEIGGGDYGRLLTDIKERVRSAQFEAFRAVNRELVALYWDIV